MLLLHDQKTCGIPGITPAYIGLRGRVTEKICSKRGIVILKHMQCTLIGWHLHVADKRMDIPGAERFLEQLPKCLFLKVDNVDWIIDPRLGPGVFPLHPVYRTWELNKDQGVKICRRGFTWVPDFASTAFMMQGATLKAGLADCGDVEENVGGQEAMQAYVILSRLQRAEGLLLMRAFSPMLFQQGEAPGPHVLLKLMRSQQNKSDTGTSSYSFADALDEYKHRMEDVKKPSVEKRARAKLEMLVLWIGLPCRRL